MKKRIGFAALLIGLSATAALADGWFTHKFGELRAYHKDWLTVCADKGAGPCRAVQIKLVPGQGSFVGESRLSLPHLGGAEFGVVLYHRGLVPVADGDFVFDFGAARIVLAPGEWQLGEPNLVNLLETIHVTDAEKQAQLIALMRSEMRVSVSHVVEDGLVDHTDFSLRGSQAALLAIQELKDR
ncbi:hypothetical protein N6L24_11890 [Cognatishimia sp. SS12]|uniref:hypothetical protein n=1 Tax=Cognatishimia sp. SS12 TaxID=2979465 RepID=UPI00232AD523|nr:hypothetical protein [Cognatishimia sp. SS12]MDC0738980.1 hypothetical protein [Cognatishimia sp. SS12]